MNPFASLDLGWLAALLAAAAAVVWLAGTQLARCADEIAERTGLGHAFVGAVFLAIGSSLPEIATAVTGATRGSPGLVVNNLLGGVLVQTTMLAVADYTLRHGALTFFTPSSALLLQGAAVVALLGLALAGLAAGPLLVVGHVSIGSAVLFAAWLAFSWSLRRYEAGWEAVRVPEEAVTPERPLGGVSTRALALRSAGAAALILVSGWALASAADRFAAETGLGASFVGATLVSLCTSLPELSTTLAAVRQGTYSLAVSNIFGSNLVNVALLFLGDLAYREGPLLAAADRSAVFTGAMAVFATAVYLGGLVERSDRTIGRFGVDSVIVLAAYVAFLGVSYVLR